MLSRASLRVHTRMGPGGPEMGWFLRMTTCNQMQQYEMQQYDPAISKLAVCHSCSHIRSRPHIGNGLTNPPASNYGEGLHNE
jgi:hypothetical protein